MVLPLLHTQKGIRFGVELLIHYPLSSGFSGSVARARESLAGFLTPHSTDFYKKVIIWAI